jgi:hypothetical protein
MIPREGQILRDSRLKEGLSRRGFGVVVVILISGEGRKMISSFAVSLVLASG